MLVWLFNMRDIEICVVLVYNMSKLDKFYAYKLL